MLNSNDQHELDLTIVITVVGGPTCVRRCLKTICPQLKFDRSEVIVPYDTSSLQVGQLSEEFPQVIFHFIHDSNAFFASQVDLEHRLYDRRRSRGLLLARGRIIAMIEDYALPAPDWCKQILLVHEQPYAAIGGAIENAVDRPLNWALYYCDFGRYGRPFVSHKAEYASDVNISYKRKALTAVRDVWQSAYQETTVNWALRSRGETVFVDPRIVVFQCRPRITFRKALVERVEWGRVFAETRVGAVSILQRVTCLLGTAGLPVLLLCRVLKHMLRQRRPNSLILKTFPLAACLLIAWSAGEFTGYLRGRRFNASFSETAPI